MTGVDINPQPRYVGDAFFQADALKPPVDLKSFDFIWASPPCQAYSGLTPETHRNNHEPLIAETRAMLKASGVPYCIENVAGARFELSNPIMLCGSMFGLRTQRHRYFETSFPLFQLLPPCDHSIPPLLVTTASAGSRAKRAKLGMAFKTVKNAPAAYGIDWMNSAELAEAIPPAFSEFIARAFLNSTRRAA